MAQFHNFDLSTHHHQDKGYKRKTIFSMSIPFNQDQISDKEIYFRLILLLAHFEKEFF